MKVNNIIYTPISLWADFEINLNFKESYLSEVEYDGIVFKNMYFSGRQVGSEDVRIFASLAIPKNCNGNAIVIGGDIVKGINMELVSYFANLGYCVLMPDLKGLSEEANFTIYPADISYANFDKSKDELFKVETNVKETCWYEWSAVIRHCVAFCKYNLKLNKIGLYGVKTGANVCWISITGDVNCFISLFGCGWQLFSADKSYKDIINFTDEQRKFVAGLQAESYAPYIKCPVLYMGPTNNFLFDCEFAMDTLARLPGKSYCDFSPRMRFYLDSLSLNNCKLFFEKHLCGGDLTFYDCPEVNVNFKETEIVFNVDFYNKNEIESCNVFYSTHVQDMFKRNWKLLSNRVEKKYTIQLKDTSNFISFFVRVKYKNGLSLSSPIYTKNTKQQKAKSLVNVLFSGRSQENSFACLMPLSVVVDNFFNEKEVGVDIVKGPMDIYGAYCKSGLINYNIGESSYLLNSSNMIKFDFFSAKYNEFIVSLLTCNKNTGEIKEYKYSSIIKGAKVWNNFCELLTEFKDENGKTIKDFSSVYAITFYSNEKFLISNLLVV